MKIYFRATLNNFSPPLLNLQPMDLKNLLLSAAAFLALPMSVSAQQPYDNPGVTADPPQGEVSKLQRISLTFENEKVALPNLYQYSITVTRYGEEEVLMTSDAKTDDVDWNVLHLTLERTLRDPGTYVITVPEGAVYNFDYAPLPETKWLYTVTGAGDEPIEFKPYENIGVDISPRQGVYPKIGEDFRLNFDYPSIGANPAKMIRMIDDESGVVCGTFSIDYTFTDDSYAVLNQFVLKSDREVTAPGSYTLQFPDGTFYRSSDGEDIGAFNFRYVVDEKGQAYVPDPTYSFVYPSSGTTLRKIERLVVTYPDFETAKPAPGNDVKVFDAIGNVVGTGTLLDTKDRIGHNQVEIKFNPAITDDGEYTVAINTGAILVGANNHPGGAIALEYTVNKNAFDPADPNGPYDNRGVRISPEQGTYKSLNSFILTFDCKTTGIDYSKQVYVRNDETPDVNFGTCWVDYGANFGSEVTVDVLPYMNVPGTYTIYFPHGTFYDYGQKPEEPLMPAFKFRYKIEPDGEVVTPVAENVVADPATGSVVTSLDFINVTFPDFTKIDRNRIIDELNVEIQVLDSKGELVAEGLVNPVQTGLAPNTMQIKFDPEVVDGDDYTIIFARRVFLLGEEGDQRFNEEFKLNYKVAPAGVDMVENEGVASPASIYTLDGVRVDDIAVPGVYIIVNRDGTTRKATVR